VFVLPAPHHAACLLGQHKQVLPKGRWAAIKPYVHSYDVSASNNLASRTWARTRHTACTLSEQCNASALVPNEEDEPTNKVAAQQVGKVVTHL